MVRIILIVCILMSACISSPLIRYAEVKYPDCKIQKLDSNSISTKLRITCPNEEPFEKVYRSQ